MLTSAEWLQVWEIGWAQKPIEWALTLLTLAFPDQPVEELACLSIGQRDARLLALREQLMGAQVDSVTTCPACDEELELSFDVADLRAATPLLATDTLSLNVDDCHVEFRLLDSLDLIAAASTSDQAAARRSLFERSILQAHGVDGVLAADQLSESMVGTVAAQMAVVDPQADIQIELVCPACGYTWQTGFDPVRFMWSELNAWALHALRDVHRLASAYGWSEADILAMHPGRRQIYLDSIG
ncbi:MAG TPA: phage baseplate protein [Anaerolineae bacterium]|nr:phage baseplate protein [Anaerolineae bacterium]